MAKLYLIHRYDVEHDKYIWPMIRQKAANRNKPIAHCDYSENLQEVPKFEPQDMHFNKKSHSLHCTVIHQSTDSKDNHYVYHFSNITAHDWAHSRAVDMDLHQEFFSEETIVREKNGQLSCPIQMWKCFWG